MRLLPFAIFVGIVVAASVASDALGYVLAWIVVAFVAILVAGIFVGGLRSGA